MRMSFLGDIMLPMDQLEQYKSNNEYDFYPAVAAIAKEFKESDIVIANLETPIAGKQMEYTFERYSFNSPIDLPKALRKVGITMVTTANNHCLDRGTEGLIRTIKNLHECDMEIIGTHAEREKSYVIKEINGIKIGLLAFTYGTNAFSNRNYLENDQKYMVDLLQGQELSHPLVRHFWLSNHRPIRYMRAVARRLHIGQFDKQVYERREKDKAEIQNYRNAVMECRNDGVDYIVACLHIGGQYNEHPTDYTKKICQLSRQLGVNAVIANHEHVIHGIDTEHLSDTSFCIYSLGNFLSSTGVTREPYDKLAQYSVAVNIDLDKDKNGKLKAAYTFEIFCNCSKGKSKVVSEPLIDCIMRCADADMKEKLIRDYNNLMNRICNTEGKDYPLQREYALKI
ncbi:MAG: CapA family protein [Lachnospiraceae bacterium]|nr:CapA family protein [Lachnospiraceae bacterium]